MVTIALQVVAKVTVLVARVLLDGFQGVSSVCYSVVRWLPNPRRL